jgi:hypothetical protein
MIVGWRRLAREQLSHVDGLLRLLMKRRNGEPWSREDKQQLRRGLRLLARWTPGVFLFLLPGGMLLLPAYAWLLDQRRGRARIPAGQRESDKVAAAAAVAERAS